MLPFLALLGLTLFWFLLPLLPWSRRPAWQLRLGLSVYGQQFKDEPWANIPSLVDWPYEEMSRLDPKTNTAVGKIALDCPFDIIPYKDSLWVEGWDDTHTLLTHIQP